MRVDIMIDMHESLQEICTKLFPPFLQVLLALALLRLRRITITATLLPSDITLMAQLRIVETLLVLVTQPDLILFHSGIWTIELLSTEFARRTLVTLSLEPGAFGARHDLVSVLDEVLALGDLHLCLGELLLGLLFLQDLFHLVCKVLRLLSPVVRNSHIHHAAGDLGALGFARFHCCLDYFPIRICGNRACAT